jgi:hypothetical protein
MKHVVNKVMGSVLVGTAILLAIGAVVGLPFNLFM